jgi:MFS family permease
VATVSFAGLAWPALRLLPSRSDDRSLLGQPPYVRKCRPFCQVPAPRRAVAAADGLAIYAPLFLQRLHGVSPLGAGYMVALASLAWTTAALSVASLSEEWPPRLIVIGPSAMGAGLAGVGVLMAPGPVTALILPIVLIGAGIGAAWAFVLQRVMSGAKAGEENIAAASAATVQQAGIALGAATPGWLPTRAVWTMASIRAPSCARRFGFPWRWSRLHWRPVQSACD